MSKQPMLLIDLARRCRELIASARQAGVVIDDGNVVDLVADNTEASLSDIRCALVVAGYGDEFKNATKPH